MFVAIRLSEQRQLEKRAEERKRELLRMFHVATLNGGASGTAVVIIERLRIMMVRVYIFVISVGNVLARVIVNLKHWFNKL